MTPDDLFIDAGRDGLGLPAQKADVALLSAVLDGTYTATPDADVALAIAEQLHRDLTAYGTSGGPELTEGEAKLAIRSLTATCARIGVPFTLPFRDYTGFRAYWVKNDGHGSWHARRQMVNELMDPVIEALGARAGDPHTHSLPDAALDALTDPSAILDSLRRVARAVDSDPRLAVSAAKDLMESTAKLVLSELGETYSSDDDLPLLANKAQQVLGLTKKSLAGKDGESIGQLLGSLSGLVGGIAQLRNSVGVGHGRESVPEWVKPRHARVASGTATTWCSLMLETLADPDAPWRMARG